MGAARAIMASLSARGRAPKFTLSVSCAWWGTGNADEQAVRNMGRKAQMWAHRCCKTQPQRKQEEGTRDAPYCGVPARRPMRATSRQPPAARLSEPAVAQQHLADCLPEGRLEVPRVRLRRPQPRARARNVNDGELHLLASLALLGERRVNVHLRENGRRSALSEGAGEQSRRGLREGKRQRAKGQERRARERGEQGASEGAHRAVVDNQPLPRLAHGGERPGVRCEGLLPEGREEAQRCKACERGCVIMPVRTRYAPVDLARFDRLITNLNALRSSDTQIRGMQ